MGPGEVGGERWTEGWVSERRSGFLCCHRWLTACLSAQRSGMIGSWPAENGPATFTYIHISQALPGSACVCVCVCERANMQIRPSSAFDFFF